MGLKLMGIFKIPVIIVFMLTGISAYSQQVQKISPAGTKYLLYTPPGYNPGGGPYPLLVTLHGQGTIGDDLNALLTFRDQIPAKLIAQQNWPATYPFIVVTPLLKRDESIPDSRDQLWNPTLVDEVVEHVRSAYSVNTNKIYVTGLSLGAHGSYSYAAAYPEKVAAVVMISGVPDTLIACQVKNIPIWAFHGSDDGLVPRTFPTGMVRSINACNPRGKFIPHLTMLYARKHEGWNEIYNNTDGYYIYDWLLKFTKNDPANTPPYVNAGNDLTIVKRDPPLHVFGEYFDSDGTVSNVLWTKVSGPEITLEGIQTNFLKLSNLATGAYEFELQVTDNNSAQKTDRVKINITDGSPSFPAVTGLLLMNSETQQDIASLTDGYILNPEILGTNKINLRATTSGSTGSVRYKINSNHNAETIETAPYLLANPRWTVDEGEYLVCATAFPDAKAQGTPGISQCYKIIVTTVATPPPPPPPPPPAEEIKLFYAKAGTDISLLSSWSSKADGTGVAPTSFSLKDLVFEVQSPVLLSNPLTIDGAGSVFRMKDTGELTLNNQLTATLHAEGKSVIHVNSNHPVNFGTLSLASTINFNGTNSSIPVARYGNVSLKGGGTTKTLSPGTITISGNLTIDHDVQVNGGAAPGSVLAASGDVNILEKDVFESLQPFTLVFEKGGVQAFNLWATHLLLHEIVVVPNTQVQVKNNTGKSLLELGTAAGGGLTVSNDAKLYLQKNDLLITGKGTINKNGETGQTGFSKTQFTMQSTSDSPSHLYTITGSDSLQNFIIDVAGNGALSIHQQTYIVDHINVIRGKAHSNGFLTLVSTADKNARLLTTEQGAEITGDVVFQRWIPKGKQDRYISIPVGDVTVSEVQTSLPITGNFTGSSTGPGLSTTPSLFYYDDTKGGWIPYPKLANTETFSVGKGYSIRINDEARGTKLIVSGPVQEGNFTYTLTGNESNNPEKGWNLIGNPYASPIQWNQEDWVKTGVNTTAYLLDDSYPGGRFLVWDGETGDEEFSGLITQAQGIFVRSTSASPTLEIKETAKVDTSFNLFRQKKSQASREYFAITLSQNALSDKAYVKFTLEGTPAFDAEDGIKRKNGYFSLSTLSQDSVPLAINNFTEGFCDQAIALSLAGTPPGTYQLHFRGTLFERASIDINLIDHYTNKQIKLVQNTQYTFQIATEPATYGKSRFEILLPTGAVQDPFIAVLDNILSSNVTSGNQWLLNGENINGATDVTYLPQVSGEYRLRVTNKGCSKVSAPVNITVNITDVVEEKNNGLQFYPNPAADEIQFQTDIRPASPVYYSITTATGVLVGKGEISPDALIKGSAIDIKRLPSGVYFFLLQTPERKYHARFVVK